MLDGFPNHSYRNLYENTFFRISISPDILNIVFYTHSAWSHYSRQKPQTHIHFLYSTNPFFSTSLSIDSLKVSSEVPNKLTYRLHGIQL